MKYLAKSQNNKMIQLGEDVKKGKWYYVTEGVLGEIETLNVGDEITFVSEPRGGAFYVTFLAKGSVTPPVQEAPKQEVLATPVPSTVSKPSPVTKTWVKNDNVDWDSKERRDFKGRSIAYASSAMTNLVPKEVCMTEDEYLTTLLRIAKKIEEYIYTK
jgi:hypothetical protein